MSCARFFIGLAFANALCMLTKNLKKNKKISNSKRRRGFTLVELLVVIMVIGILVTLAVSRYINVRDNGLVSAAIYDLDLVRKLLAYYSVDYDMYPETVSSYDDLQSQLVDRNGKSLGELPYSNTFTWLSYALDANGHYIIRIQATDNHQTVIVGTPDAIHRE